jgi:nucleoside 2-deoxyribosyltransferase
MRKPRITSAHDDYSRNNNGILSVSILGSYNKHLMQIGQAMRDCKKADIKVLIPKNATRVSSTNGFCILRGEKGDPRELQDYNFGAIRSSDFALVVNPAGYIGPSTSLEVGYAFANHVPIYCTEEPEHYVFRLYVEWGKTPTEIKREILGCKPFSKNEIELAPVNHRAKGITTRDL